MSEDGRGTPGSETVASNRDEDDACVPYPLLGAMLPPPPLPNATPPPAPPQCISATMGNNGSTDGKFIVGMAPMVGRNPKDCAATLEYSNPCARRVIHT